MRAIPDEELYVQLANHQLNFPTPLPVEDYVYRCDVWEMVNKALHAEIARRRATPPPWWPQPREKLATSTRRHLTALGIYTGILTLAGAAGAVIGHQ
ncbi:hypothetical protein Rhe02_89390 [Rhizocola hellebori]|uniref:Uncharacterized protein n=1 Tax=Rhizocola hellebori TaxID=1392758 RepID=A0A8J3VLN8_9ACTN|nr:hypothetical protein [Rhizocola hellebori]GIH10872.1 hypothetical protein Rhe02_89390 [Rhizocola hellebori]